MTSRQSLALYLLLRTVEHVGLRVVVVGVTDAWGRTGMLPVIFSEDGRTPWSNRSS